MTEKELTVMVGQESYQRLRRDGETQAINFALSFDPSEWYFLVDKSLAIFELILASGFKSWTAWGILNIILLRIECPNELPRH